MKKPELIIISRKKLTLAAIAHVTSSAIAALIATIVTITIHDDDSAKTIVKYVPTYVDVPMSVVVNLDAKLPVDVYEVTAYTAGAESTGKSETDPAYGITASGERVKEGVTAACPRELPFGTQLYIPYFDNVYTCQDRGSAITDGHVDIYMDDVDEALAFGRRELDVIILPSGEESK